MRGRSWIFGLVIASASGFAADAPEPEATASVSSEADHAIIVRLLEKGDDLYRGSSSQATMTMEVVTAHYTRSMTMTAVSQGSDNTLIRIVKPAKDAGVATLKVGENLWNYLPAVDRTMKVPKGMMSGAWMGSHFSNDDLVRDSRFSDDYTATILTRPSGGRGLWTIRCVPKPDAAVVWGHVEVDIDADEILRAIRYYDEHDKLVRTMTMSDIETVSGRRLPRTMTMQPADKPTEHTSVHYDTIEFDVDLPANTFSLSALRP